MLRGTFEYMKSVNKTTILNKIRLSGSISRADIARETGITPPTVSSLVKELIRENLVIESRLGQSIGGRKPTLLQLKEDGYYVIGLDAGSKTIKGIVSDLVGNIYDRVEVDIYPNITKEEFLTCLSVVAEQLVGGNKQYTGRILGIGVAMHGIIDVKTGTSLSSVNSGLLNVPIKQTLEKQTDLQVLVENNSRAMTLGEYWFGNESVAKRFAVINIGRGVGSGLIEDNKLIHGAHGVAGEIGHASISLEGERCSCGNIGCLETFVTGEAIVRRAKRSIPDAPENLTAEGVYRLAKQGKREYIQALEETGRLIGVGIVNFIHTANPNKIVLSGGVMKSKEFLLPSIQQIISERALIDETIIEVSKLGDDITVLGAAALLLNDLFYCYIV
ncbi:ROK family transcriptional regulator [Neobacillus sp. MM2021_6]|uniref:ROK family transcriptional regulator n=1 Tax=Bacillaceae TaxID=186817 RepID=UPI00140B2523|nr:MULTISPECIES: ROK family transcriptional regulator [Bacillaceae]MBO0961357.1 ROK family transcriptional regulator [Neobacillus sp. MM2021_6]NHC20525.1 ROK family transcriptional regulator [Bacillus sp. MM2020_4]